MTRAIAFTRRTLSDDEPFRDAVGELLASQATGEGVVIDFSALELSTSQRLRPFHLLVLANVLLSTAGEIPVKLKMPTSDSARLAVLRSGIVFSLACRPSPITPANIQGIEASERTLQQWLELWRLPWSPFQPALGRLFHDEPRPVDEAPVLRNFRNAKNAIRVVVDAHLNSRDSLLQQASNGLAGAWLQSVTPSSQDRAVQHRRDVWQKLVTSRVLGEPLINLPDHALTCPQAAVPFNREVRSLVLLARTDGGGGKSHPRLHLVVADNGYGLVRTLRPKLRSGGATPAESNYAEKSAADVMTFAMSRPAKTVNDPGLAWARSAFGTAITNTSTGLTSTEGVETDLADTEFTLITGDPENSDNTVWARTPSSGRAEDVMHGIVDGVPFIGTTVFASLPIPHGADSNSGRLLAATASARD